MLLDSLDTLDDRHPFPHGSFGIIRSLSRAACAFHAKLVNDDLGTYQELKSINATGDVQSLQDSLAHDSFQAAISEAEEIAYLVSEEALRPVRLGNGRISVAIDPFDGSKAFKYGIPAGTIFGLFLDCEDAADFCGRNLFASGFFLYSLNVELVLCVNGRVYFVKGDNISKLANLEGDKGFISVNIANMRFWDKPWKEFFNSRIISSDTDKHYNNRWFGSLVTHAKTVILSGGLFAYPPDNREGYQSGYLRLVYEALPVSLIIESLGGASSSGVSRIMESKVETVHDKTPLAFGELTLVKELNLCLNAYPFPAELQGRHR